MIGLEKKYKINYLKPLNKLKKKLVFLFSKTN